MPPKKKAAPATVTPDPVAVVEPEIDAASAAVEEAVPGVAGPLVFKFRGVTFEIDREIFTSARFLLTLRKFRYQDILYEVVGPDGNTDKFLSTVKFKEPVQDVANEFLDALNAAGGWGKFSAS